MPHHQRIVLQLPHGAASQHFMREAAEMARLLGTEMCGVFVEDEAIHGLAAMPFARELRLPSHDWQPIDAGQIAADFQHAATAAKRLLDTVAHTMGVTCGFEVRRGNPSGVVAELLCSSDIVVLGEPRLGTEALTQWFLTAWQTAMRSDASVLLLPPQAIRRRGPVVALKAAPGQRAVRTAAHIARIGGESLLLLSPPDDLLWRDAAATTARSLGIPIERISSRDITTVTETGLAYALADFSERLLVLDRDGFDAAQEAAVLRVAAARATPVLLIGPAGEG